jgi:hypothetical protein
MGYTVGSLSQAQKGVIIGTLLGDGYLRIVDGRKDAFLEINHSYSEKQYVDWKYDHLKKLVKSPPKKRKGNGKRIAYRFYTKQIPYLTHLFKEFYKNKEKVIPSWLKLNPLILAVWFMDDGHKSRKTYYLNSQQFDVKTQRFLMKLLAKLGIRTTLNKDKTYFRIRIRQSSSKRFRNLIKRLVIPKMRYKLGDNPVETFLVSNQKDGSFLP